MTDDQPDGIDTDSHDLPDPMRAAERVAEFLRDYGDGLIERDPNKAPPLYARDLEVLSRLPEKVAELDAEAERLRVENENLRIDRDIALADAHEQSDIADEYSAQLNDARIEIDVLRTYYAYAGGS